MNKLFTYFQEMEIDVFWYKQNKSKQVKNDSNNLTNLQNQVANCKACILHETRTKTVFGEGASNSNIMIIGEAPGKDEDLEGKPFIGRAGKLLNEILFSVDLKRDDIFITNTVKCRPPDNRNPHDTEVTACSSYLDEQINFIKPKILILLGKVAADRVLKLDLPMSELRGKTFNLESYDVPIIVFYHPAYLLRSPSNKSKAWDDLKYMRTVMEVL